MHGAVAQALEDERVRLVLPLDAVLVEDPRDPALDGMGKPGRIHPDPAEASGAFDVAVTRSIAS